MHSIVTRFAPSPTGMLHIGGVRTALINWLFARHHNGCYLLRIEDTDRKRSTPEAMSAIRQGLAWLDLQGDAEPMFQSSRLQRHQEVARRLLEEGAAYRCRCTAETLESMRREARAAGRTRMYNRRCRERAFDESQPHVVRVKVPTSGESVIEDLIQGRVTVNNDHLDDYILLRADGSPTYMLSCVVDDADMAISHVIRGDDHLNNAFRQLQLIRVANFCEPRYAHLALLHGEDGTKLSKRHGALGIAHYQEAGYLPEAILNALLRLGWGKGEEFLSRQAAAQIFTLHEMSKAPARVDFTRLDHFNAHYLRDLADQDPAALIARLSALDENFTPEPREILMRGLPALAQRATTLKTLLVSVRIYQTAPQWPLDDAKTEKQFLDKAPAAALDRLLAGCPDWNFAAPADLKAQIEQHVADLGVSFGKIGQPLRIALCGTMQAPDIGDILYALGLAEVRARLKNAVEHLAS